MRIPRPVGKKVAFKRRSSPPPAARKLLTASLASGLILLAMLAIVFVPRGFQYEPLPVLPRIEFTYNVTAPGRVSVIVSIVTLVRPFSQYNATYYRASSRLAALEPLSTSSGNATLSFRDADNDGNLSVGDEFAVAYNGAEALRLWYVPGSAIVGFWPPPP